RRHERRYDPQERRLASAVGAQQAEQLARLDLEADAGQRAPIAVRVRERLDAQRERARHQRAQRRRWSSTTSPKNTGTYAIEASSSPRAGPAVRIAWNAHAGRTNHAPSPSIP